MPTLNRPAHYTTNKDTAVKRVLLSGLQVRQHNPRVSHIEGALDLKSSQDEMTCQGA